MATIAEFATIVNERTENIGARRLHTVMERLLDEVSFDAPNLTDKAITIDAAIRPAHAGRHREERRSVPIHPVSMSTRMAALAAASLAVAVVACLRRCGNKGPPLAPFVRVPAIVTTVTGQRVGTTSISRLQCRRRTSTGGSRPTLRRSRSTRSRPTAPRHEEQRDVATLIATVPVRPMVPELPVPANGSAPPPIPLPPASIAGRGRRSGSPYS